MKLFLWKIVSKFKNYCPISIGSIDVRYDTRNPAELYPSTTWELITTGKYILSGDTALQVGGDNSLRIERTNLPNTKLKVDSFSVSTQPHTHPIRISYHYSGGVNCISGYDLGTGGDNSVQHGSNTYNPANSGGGTTGTASPYTEVLGNGSPISIQPTYITLKFWKRLS